MYSTCMCSHPFREESFRESATSAYFADDLICRKCVRRETRTEKEERLSQHRIKKVIYENSAKPRNISVFLEPPHSPQAPLAFQQARRPSPPFLSYLGPRWKKELGSLNPCRHVASRVSPQVHRHCLHFGAAAVDGAKCLDELTRL